MRERTGMADRPRGQAAAGTPLVLRPASSRARGVRGPTLTCRHRADYLPTHTTDRANWCGLGVSRTIGFAHVSEPRPTRQRGTTRADSSSLDRSYIVVYKVVGQVIVVVRTPHGGRKWP
jgi:hypothetical protein